MVNQKKLNIAFIHPDLGIGGAERLVLDLAGALKNDGHCVKFITNHFDKEHAFDELKNGQYFVEVYGDWIPRSAFGVFQALWAYIRMMYLAIVYLWFNNSKDKVDLYFTDLIPVANVFLKLANEKVIYYCHHPDLLASMPGGRLKQIYRQPINWLELKATAKADLILVNSEYTASVFKETFPEIRKPLKILYPTVAYSYQKTVETLNKIRPIEEIVPSLKSNIKEKIVFLSLNRFHPAKKLDLAILAMEQLKKNMPSSEWDKIFLIISGGYDPQSEINKDTYNYLISLTMEKKLGDKIFFLKSPNDNIKAELLCACYCLLYTPVKEHFGIVPLEAMLVKKPVIAVNSGGPRETVDHGNTGYLCEATPESMAYFMSRILKEDVAQMGTAARKRLDEKFSYNYFKKHLTKIIEGVSENSTTKKLD